MCVTATGQIATPPSHTQNNMKYFTFGLGCRPMTRRTGPGGHLLRMVWTLLKAACRTLTEFTSRIWSPRLGRANDQHSVVTVSFLQDLLLGKVYNMKSFLNTLDKQMTSFHLCICVKKQHIHINTLAINLAKPSCISEWNKIDNGQ